MKTEVSVETLLPSWVAIWAPEEGNSWEILDFMVLPSAIQLCFFQVHFCLMCHNNQQNFLPHRRPYLEDQEEIVLEPPSLLGHLKGQLPKKPKQGIAD